MQTCVPLFSRLISFGQLVCAAALAWTIEIQAADWRVGGYVGQYYDTMPAGLLTQGDARFWNQYLLALTASHTLWQNSTLALEIDGMVGQQFGLASLSEVGVAPVVRWRGLPGRATLPLDLRFAPLGISYTSTVSPLERGRNGQGSHTLNLLLIEFAFPLSSQQEGFIRLHHRCTIYDLLNDYGANGEDFLALGYRQSF